MSSEFEKNLERYADVILSVGLNLQKGQHLLIGAPAPYNYGVPIELAPLIRIITKKAYQIGARFVEVLWDDDIIKLIRFQYASKDAFREFPTWRTDAEYHFAKNADAILIIVAFSPDLLKEQDSSLFMTSVQAYLDHDKSFADLRHQDAMNNLVITAPVKGWVNKLFPDLTPEKGNAKLWEILFKICRLNKKDPIKAWKDHIAELQARSKVLNKKQYVELKMVAPGTELEIGLPKRHNWQAAMSTSKSGIDFVGNIPTEEIFTLPHKNKVEGFVKLTKPFSRVVLVEDLKLVFSEGKIIQATAKKGQDFINNILNMDEGARRLGEVALVPHSSPISQTRLLFHNVLIDENASCHIALGNAWRSCLEGGNLMTDQEFSAAGGNISKLHYDFMIGSDKMDIDGTLKNGDKEPIMRNGEWFFDI
ncbi:MAG: aminopeptidase [Promethearchaeota archaeon]